jgi:hypothetical protein
VPLLALLALCLFLAGCGVDTPDITIPTVPRFEGSGDAATFVVDHQTIVVQQSGTVSVSTGASSPLTYSGPLGCRGRYFTGHLTEHIGILFRYSARDAYMLIGPSQLYRFPGRPGRRRGELVWSRTFPDRHIAVLVRCPPPPRGSGPLGR